MILQISNPTAKLVIPKGKPTKKANVEIKTEAIRAEAKLSKCSIQFEVEQFFLRSLLINLLFHYVLFRLKDNFFSQLFLGT